jgi:putative transposase
MRSSHTDTLMLRLMPEFGLVDLADARLGERLAETGARHLETFAHEMHRGLLAASVAIGLDVLGEMLAADATAAAGPKGKHNTARTANWHGREIVKSCGSGCSGITRRLPDSRRGLLS